jgi:hypothetical protein
VKNAPSIAHFLPPYQRALQYTAARDLRTGPYARLLPIGLTVWPHLGILATLHSQYCEKTCPQSSGFVYCIVPRAVIPFDPTKVSFCDRLISTYRAGPRYLDASPLYLPKPAV